MNERQMQFRVGAIVFFTLIVGGVLVSLTGPLSIAWLPWGQAKYQVGIQVPQAPGVDTNTPVRKNGILIGRVKAIEDQDNGVLLRAEVNGNRPLYAEYEPHIRTTVLGDATIDFFSRPPAPGSQPVADGTVFQGVVDPHPFDALAQIGELTQDFASASRSLQEAGGEITKLARRVNEAFGEETADGQGRVRRMLDTTERAMLQFTQTMTAINEIIGDEPAQVTPIGAGQAPYHAQPLFNNQPQPAEPAVQPSPEGRQMRQRIRQGLNELPDAIKDIRNTMQDARSALQSAEKNFKNLEPFTEQLSQTGDSVGDSVLQLINRMDRLVSDVTRLTQAINSREGTLGKLIYEPQFYDNLTTLMFNINRVLGRIHELTVYLEPVVKDARIFMSKVATEPGRIISGAVNPSIIK